MKKILALIVALLLVVSLVGCGGEEAEVTDVGGEEIEATQAVAGETYPVGDFSVYVPGGWKAFPVTDIFSDDNAIDGSVIQICKGGETEFDIYSKPYIRLNYYGPGITMGRDKSFYDDVVDLDPITAGAYTWEGFSCTSMGYKMTILWMTDGECDYQAVVYTETDGGNISVTDADVLEILASVTPA